MGTDDLVRMRPTYGTAYLSNCNLQKVFIDLISISKLTFLSLNLKRAAKGYFDCLIFTITSFVLQLVLLRFIVS